MPASDVLRRGLSELTALCEHVLATFEVSQYEFGLFSMITYDTVFLITICYFCQKDI